MSLHLHGTKVLTPSVFNPLTRSHVTGIAGRTCMAMMCQYHLCFCAMYRTLLRMQRILLACKGHVVWWRHGFFRFDSHVSARSHAATIQHDLYMKAEFAECVGS